MFARDTSSTTRAAGSAAGFEAAVGEAGDFAGDGDCAGDFGDFAGGEDAAAEPAIVAVPGRFCAESRRSYANCNRGRGREPPRGLEGLWTGGRLRRRGKRMGKGALAGGAASRWGRRWMHVGSNKRCSGCGRRSTFPRHKRPRVGCGGLTGGSVATDLDVVPRSRLVRLRGQGTGEVLTIRQGLGN